MKDLLSRYLRDRIEAKYFPSAAYLIAEEGKIVLEDAFGLAVAEPERIEACADSIYDLASLTKVLVTGLLSAQLIQNGKITLKDKIAKFFGEFNTEEKREITIENLLTHTSGIKAWVPFYLIADSKFQILNIIASQSLENPINEKVVYSDLNFLLLGFLIEKIYGRTLDEIAETEIFQPLKLRDTFFHPPKELTKRIAASEKGNIFEKQTCLDLGFEIKDPAVFRSDVIWGEVHDNNCFHLNGVSGHAGLFSTAREVFEIAKQFLPETTTVLRPETCELFRTNFTPNLDQARSIGFQLAETEDSTAGYELSNKSFGHLGFTGTSLWIDPSKHRIFILLTNRTHKRNLPFADLKETRQTFHDISCKILDRLGRS